MTKYDEQENIKIEYLERIERLVEDMIFLSNLGIKENSGSDYLVLCGTIRDCAFKIRKMLNEVSRVPT